MKKFLLVLFGVLWVGLFAGAQAKAVTVDPSKYKEASYTIEFKSSTASTQISAANVATYISSGAEYFTSYEGTTAIYQSANGIRIGKTSAGDYQSTFNLSANGKVKAASIVVNAAAYSASAAASTNYTVQVNGTQVGSVTATNGNLTDATFDLSDLTDVSSIKIVPNKAICVKSITVNYAVDKEPHGLSFPALTAEATVGDVSVPLVLSNPKGLAITYASSNTAVATVANDGTVTALESGQTTITATTDGNADVTAGSVSYVLNVIAEHQEPANLSIKEAVVKTIYGQKCYASDNINNPNSLSLNYSSSNPSVATINKVTGYVTVNGVGSTVINANFAGNDDYTPGAVSYTIEVAKAPTSLSWEGGMTALNLGETFTPPTLKMEPASLASQVTLTASGNLTVANGVVSLIPGQDGYGKVVASFESPYYESATAAFEVNVTDPYAFEESFDITSFSSTGTGFNYDNGDASFSDSKINIAGYTINNKGDIQLGPNSYIWLNANPLGLKISEITLTYGKANEARVRVTVTGSDKVEESATDYTTELCNYIHELGETEYVIRPAGDIRSFYLRPSGALYLSKVTIQYQQITPDYSFEKSEYTAYTDGIGWQSPRLQNAPEGLALTYTSSDATVATVDDNGVVAIQGKEGKSTITAANAATKIYRSYSTTTEVNVEVVTQQPADLSFTQNNVEVTEVAAEYGKDFEAPQFNNPYNLPVTFTSSNTSVATVNAEGVVSITGVGSATITAATVGDRDYRSAEVSYVLNVAKGKVTLSWSKDDDLELTLGDAYEAPVLNVTPESARSAVKFTTKGILSVVDGKVVMAEGLDGSGEVAASIESDLYEHIASVVYKVEVLDPDKIHDLLLVRNFPNAGSGANYAISTGTGEESISGVEYSARVVNYNGNFQMNSDGIWISNNKNDLTISKITLLFASNTANGRTATIYGSDKVEANTSDYNKVLANFTKTDTDQDFEYRFTSDDCKSFFISLSGAAYVEEIVVQYSKITPSYTFAKDVYEVRMFDSSFIAPTVNAPEGLTISYTSSNLDVAEYEGGVLQRYEEGETTITASNEAEGVYNAYSTSYTLKVLPQLKNELGEVNVNINDEREVAENDATINVLVNDKVVISVLNATEMTVQVDGDVYTATVENSVASCDVPVTAQGEYTVTVTAKNEHFENTTTFTLVADYDEAKVIGEFTMNGDIIGETYSDVVYIGLPIVFEIANAVDFMVDGTSIGATTSYTFTPKEVGTISLNLAATDEYGVEVTANVELEVVVPTDEVLDFIANDYGMVRLDYNKNNTVLTGTSYTYTLNNQTRLLDGNNALRFYNGGVMTVAIPDGYVIDAITDANDAPLDITGMTVTIGSDKTSATLSYSGSSASLTGLKVAIREYVVPDPATFTPLYANGEVIVAKNSDGTYSISMQIPGYDEVHVYYRYTPFRRSIAAQRRVVSHEGFTKADSDGDTHTITVPSSGVVEYYAYHPTSDTKGIERAVTIQNSGDVTSIDEIGVDEENDDEVYDLQGRRIAKPTRGLYIVNGEKVLIRK